MATTRRTFGIGTGPGHRRMGWRRCPAPYGTYAPSKPKRSGCGSVDAEIGARAHPLGTPARGTETPTCSSTPSPPKSHTCRLVVRMSELPSAPLAYLQERHSLTLATASVNGLPHAASFVYVNDGLTVYFATFPGSRTAQDIGQNAAVAFTIDAYSPDWSGTRGLQASGECEVLLNPGEIRHVAELFHRKFPFVSEQLTSDASFFRIVPSEIYAIDNPGNTDRKQDLTSYRRSLVYSVSRESPVVALDSVEPKLESVKVDAGQIIVRQGAPADKFFIIVDGSVEVVQEGDQQERQTVTTLRDGEFFGEIGILRNTLRTATVRALTPTKLLAMDRETFRGFVAQALGTTQDFGGVVQERLERLQHVHSQNL
jgi:uncharacterized protein YhbP (UPF0306 family)